MKELSLEEAAQFDGKDGKPVYIVHKGKVYDVSGSRLWKGGLHMKRHHAGQDLTTDIGAAPHGIEVLERYPCVGVIMEKGVDENRLPESLHLLLKKYPMLRRHPHPMTVHFPIVFMFAASLFNLLYLLTGNKHLEITGLHCLALGVLFIPLVMLTGLFSWWLNYMAKPLSTIDFKLRFSLALFLVSLSTLIWRLAAPDVLDSFSMESVVYFLLVMSLSPLVAAIGWLGAKLTFPVEGE